MKTTIFLVLLLVSVTTRLEAGPLMFGDVPLREIYDAGLMGSSSPANTSSAIQNSSYSRENMDKKFWALVTAQHVAMVWDGRSALEAIDRCHMAGWTNCYNKNSLVGAFMQNGGERAYIAGTITQVGIDMLALVMKNSEYKLARQTWYLLPLALTVMHTKDIITNERSFRPGIISSIRIEDLK